MKPGRWGLLMGLVAVGLLVTQCGKGDFRGAGRWATSANEGLFTSLAVDSLGQPHISFYDSTNGALKYTWYDKFQQIWNDQFVDFNGIKKVGWDNSLALDPGTGYPRISYYGQTDGQLLFAAWNGSQWILQVADYGAGNHDVGQFSSLALDSLGQPYIAYYDATQGSLKLATATGSTPPFSFTTSIIDQGNVGQYCSLALDPATQEYRIAYYDTGQQRNKVVAWDNATLTFYKYFVDATPGTGIFNSLAVDPASGRLHISYYNWANRSLSYAKSSVPPFVAAMTWTIEPVDANGDEGQYSSLALDGGGNPSIAYYDATFMTLKVARRLSPGGWVFTRPIYSGPSPPNTGLYDSIKFTSSGSYYISFYDQTAGQLGIYSSP